SHQAPNEDPMSCRLHVMRQLLFPVLVALLAQAGMGQEGLVYSGPAADEDGAKALMAIAGTAGLMAREFQDFSKLPQLLPSASVLMVGGTESGAAITGAMDWSDTADLARDMVADLLR
ncbi:MAG: hypothetical protein ACOYM2_10835, partial [Rectinemataceae bacterium]